MQQFSGARLTDRTTVQVRPRPIGVAMALAALGVTLLWFASRSGVPVALGAAMLTALVADGVLARRGLRWADVELMTAPDVSAGRPVPALLRVQGATRPVIVQGTSLSGEPQVLVTDERPAMIDLPSASRGVKTHVDVDVTSSGPLGLLEAAFRQRVWLPIPLAVGAFPLPHAVEWPRIRAFAMATSPTAPIGSEVARGIRPYVRGDSRRAVHWRSTARHGQLMVTERDGLGVVALRIIVQVEDAGWGTEGAFERAAWLAAEGLRRGWRVELCTFQQLAPPPPTPLGPPLAHEPLSHLGNVSRSPTGSRVHSGRPSTHRIRDHHQINQVLASAGIGEVPVRTAGTLTRLITRTKDSWL